MVDKFPSSMATIRAGNGSCGVPPSDYMNLLRSPVPGASDLPWTGMTICMLINSTWYWCTDQASQILLLLCLLTTFNTLFERVIDNNFYFCKMFH